MRHKEFSPREEKRPNKNIFLLYMSSFTLLIVLGFVSQLDLNFAELSISNIYSIASIFDLFFLELSIFLLLGGWLLGGNFISRFVLYIFSALFIAIYSVQLASFYQGGEFLSRLAVDNMNHVGLMLNSQTIKGLSLLLIICLLLPLVIECRPLRSQRKQNHLYVIPLLLFSVFILHRSDRFIPPSIQQQRAMYLEDRSMQHTAPVAAFFDTIFMKGSHFQKDMVAPDLNQFELNEIKKFGFQYDSSHQYPLLKDTIYTEPPPFEKIAGTKLTPNIIVFFTEGLSARSTNIYGSHYPQLTPNIDDFAEQSMVVKNYYNHTAATYRGLHGQLCSLYPTFGGIGDWQTNYKDLPDVTYYCLSNVFNEIGYKTIFLDAHKKDESQVDEMVSELGFKEVVTGLVLSKKYLNDAEPQIEFALSDGQFMEGLIGYLKDHEKNSATDQNPFFMGLYNLGTHAFLKMTTDGKKYGTGDNQSLNTIHNFDFAFGMFWRYFQESSYAENTIIIFTADHSHYPEKPFVEAFDEPGYQHIIVDTIPLIIYDPTRKLPAEFDARNSTSVDFAPSLIHYLNLGNHKNPFMGTSIYETENRKYDRFGVNSFGHLELYLIDDVKTHKVGSYGKHRLRLNTLDKYINISKQLEMNNRIWSNAIDKGERVRFHKKETHE